MNLDAADHTFIESMMPQDAVPVTLIAVVAWITPGDGTLAWASYIQSDEPVSSQVGLLEMAKLQALGTVECGMPFAYADDD